MSTPHNDKTHDTNRQPRKSMATAPTTKKEKTRHNDHESTREDTGRSSRCSGVEQAGDSCDATHGRALDDASKVN